MGEWALHSGDITLRVSNHNFISRSAQESDKSFLCCALMFTFVDKSNIKACAKII